MKQDVFSRQLAHGIAYRPDIDGLRAIAILIVLFFHVDIRAFRAGFMGVDIFFVISGYLITSILLRDLESNSFSLARFYERRARRILPPLCVVLACSAVAAYIVLMPGPLKEFGMSLMSVALFSSNLYFWTQGGYFDLPTEENPLLHTWSLAIEEQFYIFHPLLLFFLYKSVRPVWRERLVILMACASFLFCAYATIHHSRTAFYLLPFRAWELLLGAIVAFRDNDAHKAGETTARWVRECMALAGLACIAAVLVYVRYNKNIPFPGYIALLPTIGAALLIRAGSLGQTWVSHVLAFKPLVGIGLIFYSLYLWHWPIIVFLKYSQGIKRFSSGTASMVLLLSAILAYMSWRWVENPIRKKTVWPRQRQVFAAAVCALLVLLGTGSVPYTMNGMPGRMPTVVRFDDRAMKPQPRSAECHLPAFISDDILAMMGDKNFFCRLGQEKETPDFLTLGDSHMDSLMPLFEKAARDHGLYGLHRSVSAGFPLLGVVSEEETRSPQFRKNYITYAENVIAAVARWKVKNVVLHAQWPTWGEELPLVAQGLEQTVTALEQAGVIVWVVKSIPMFADRVPEAIQKRTQHRDNLDEVFDYTLPLAEHRMSEAGMEEVFRDLAKRHPRVRFMDPADILCADGKRCVSAKDYQILYYDRHHLNVRGAELLEPMLREFVEQVGNNRTAEQQQSDRVSEPGIPLVHPGEENTMSAKKMNDD